MYCQEQGTEEKSWTKKYTFKCFGIKNYFKCSIVLSVESEQNVAIVDSEKQ